MKLSVQAVFRRIIRLHSSQKSKSHYDRRSVSQYVLVSIPIWDFWIAIFFPKLLSCLFGAPSLTRGRVYHLSVHSSASEATRMKQLPHQWHGNTEAGSPPMVRRELAIEGLRPKSLLQSLCGVPWRGERLDAEGPAFCLADAVWSVLTLSPMR
jgi:hypothetical protein